MAGQGSHSDTPERARRGATATCGATATSSGRQRSRVAALAASGAMPRSGSRERSRAARVLLHVRAPHPPYTDATAVSKDALKITVPNDRRALARPSDFRHPLPERTLAWSGRPVRAMLALRLRQHAASEIAADQ